MVVFVQMGCACVLHNMKAIIASTKKKLSLLRKEAQSTLRNPLIQVPSSFIFA